MCLTGFSTVRKEESLGCIVPTTTADAVASGNEEREEGGEKKIKKKKFIHTYINVYTLNFFNSGILTPCLLSFLPTASFLEEIFA